MSQKGRFILTLPQHAGARKCAGNRQQMQSIYPRNSYFKALHIRALKLVIFDANLRERKILYQQCFPLFFLECYNCQNELSPSTPKQAATPVSRGSLPVSLSSHEPAEKRAAQNMFTASYSPSGTRPPPGHSPGPRRYSRRPGTGPCAYHRP